MVFGRHDQTYVTTLPFLFVAVQSNYSPPLLCSWPDPIPITNPVDWAWACAKNFAKLRMTFYTPLGLGE
jgi:hypothetical protein